MKWCTLWEIILFDLIGYFYWSICHSIGPVGSAIKPQNIVLIGGFVCLQKISKTLKKVQFDEILALLNFKVLIYMLVPNVKKFKS